MCERVFTHVGLVQSSNLHTLQGERPHAARLPYYYHNVIIRSSIHCSTFRLHASSISGVDTRAENSIKQMGNINTGIALWLPYRLHLAALQSPSVCLFSSSSAPPSPVCPLSGARAAHAYFVLAGLKHQSPPRQHGKSTCAVSALSASPLRFVAVSRTSSHLMSFHFSPFGHRPQTGHVVQP